MTRTYESKNGEIWTWEETPEVIVALKAYWDLVNGRSA
jgi:hypothetical protein